MMEGFILDLIEISFMIFFAIAFLCYQHRQERLKKSTHNLLGLLDRQIDVIKEYSRKIKSEDFKNMIELYSKFQMILKISKSNYVSFFRYDYSKRFIVSHFMFSISEKGEITHESNNPNLPVTSNILLLNFLHSDSKDLYRIGISDFSPKSLEGLDMYRGINTMYYQNVYKDDDTSIGYGYVIISYTDENHIMPEYDKEQVLRILKDIKRLV